MIKHSDIIGKPVLDKFGNKISNVEDIFYSKLRDKILAFSVNKNKILGINHTIEVKEIHSIGEDALIVTNHLVLDKKQARKEKHFTCKEVLGQEVFSQDGDSLGFVKDVLVDSRKARVIGLILTQGFFEDISKGRSILPMYESITFGADKIIIDKSLKERYIKNKQNYKKLLELL